MTTGSLLQEAYAHHCAGRLDLAESQYRQVLTQDPDDLNALQLLGALTQMTGRAAEGVVLLERAVAVAQQRGESAQHALLYCNLGNALAAAGRLADAVARYRRGIALNPAMPELHAALASALRRQGDLPGATASYEAALRLKPDHLPWLLDLANTHAGGGDVEGAVGLYRRVLALDPNQGAALRALGLALLSLARPAEAIAPLARLAAALPERATSHRELGTAYYGAKELDQAAASFARVLALEPHNAEAHWMLGSIAHSRGEVDRAEEAYRRALEHNPDLIGALFNLGLLLQRERDDPAAAIPLLEHLTQIAPDHAGAQAALGNAFRRLALVDEAAEPYRRYLACAPNEPLAPMLVAQNLRERGEKAAAIPYLERALALDPDDDLRALIEIDLGNVLQDLGRTAEARAHFGAALKLRPVTTTTAAQSPATFAALFLLAPGTCNTPYEYLIERVPFDAHILLLLPDIDYDIALLATHCDLVVNLVSDVDQGKAMLPLAAQLIAQLGKPVINHPDRIATTGREATARLLAGIPWVRVAKVERHAGAVLSAPGFFSRPGALPLPFLARLAGGHGGDDFEWIEAASDLAVLVARHPEDDHYLIEYLDYRSPDGFFRKYRFFFAGDAILPYHLAIGDSWKVHHFRTDMANQLWMQQEEELFLSAPETVFAPRHLTALRTIRERVGLDFFGIDCGLDRDDNLVVFETNASMLVHGNTRDFPYKAPYVRRIKAAFAALLARAATGKP